MSPKGQGVGSQPKAGMTWLEQREGCREVILLRNYLAEVVCIECGTCGARLHSRAPPPCSAANAARCISH